MAEIFAQVPSLAWILIAAIAFGGVWKVFDVLYVKPRDFRIHSLEMEVESLKATKNQPEFAEIPASEPAAGQPKANISVKSPEPGVLKTKRPIDSPSEREPDEGIALAEGLRSLAYAISRLQDENLTELQRDAVEEYFTGKPVVWAATIRSVRNARNGSIEVRIADGDRPFNTATAKFEDAQRKNLLKLKEGDRVVVSGTISDIFAGNPYLNECSITKATGASIAQ